MLYKIIPNSIKKFLWGDRKKFGLVPNKHDEEWKIWRKKSYKDFYPKTQQKGLGHLICRTAYPILSRLDFRGKRVLEIGPGIIRHLEYINATPELYTVCDVETLLLDGAAKQLQTSGIQARKVKVDINNTIKLPLPDKCVDIIISFNSLEHLYPLDDYLIELKRVLRKGGVLAGGIPCEGGLAWGMGRFLTTRRYVHKNYGINYDKIICWEHPNFTDFIFNRLSHYFKKKYIRKHPFPFLPFDFNLVSSFIFIKND